MPVVKVKWGKEEFDVEVEPGSAVEVFKTQVWTLTTVPVDRQKFLGFPGGVLKDTDDLDAKLAKLKPGAKVTLLGTAEGGELKQPGEKVVFEEDLSAEERAKILKEKKVEILPAGIKNLGNTCYMNSTLQCLARIEDLDKALDKYQVPPAEERDIDAVLTNQFKNVVRDLKRTTEESITPLQFVMALRQKFPRFGETDPRGNYMQQDADECLRGLLTVMSNSLKSSGGNRIDEIFGFKMSSSLKCLECDEEPPSTSEEMTRVLLCHLGTQTEPVSHISQGIQMSLKEHIEKNSPVLGRNAQYEKTSALMSLPSYMIVQFARFGFKGANEWAGTAASKVKLIRNIKFSPSFDAFDMASDDLKKVLSYGRLKRKEQDDAKLEAEKKKLLENPAGAGASSSKAPAPGADVEMTAADGDAEMPPASVVGVEEIDTGYYELVGIVSHKGRTADGGHYVGWTRFKKADGKEVKDDQWVCYDDETTSLWNWKDITGLAQDLMGGRADTQIAYINIYKKVTVSVDPGQKLGESAKEGEGGADADMAPKDEAK
jgi:ubiquitin carboxyl-terminal hydrolase 14